METDSSLNHSIDDAKKHYSSMFFLPSFKKALAAIAVLSVLIGLSAFAVSPSQGLISALVLGISLFVLTLIADLTMSKVLLKGDPIFVLRRTLMLSLFGLVFWLVFILIGVGLSFPFGWLLWVKLCLIGYAAVITLRTIVLIATSMAPSWRKGLSVLLQPTLCIIPFFVFWAGVSNVIPMQVLPFIVISPVICFRCSARVFLVNTAFRQENVTFVYSFV